MGRTARRAALGLCAGLTMCLPLAACGGDDKETKTRMVDRARAEGDRVRAKAQAAVKNPEAIAVRVSAAPKQRVTVVWALSCTNTGGKGGETAGATYSTMTPNIRELKLLDGPRDVCHVEATTRLLTGRVKTTLLAKAP